MTMERSRDLRRTSISPINGLPRRRKRITSIRDSPEDDSQMKWQLKDRELPKRRRVEKSGVQQRICGGLSFSDNESTDSSDDEYLGEEHNLMNKPSPPSSSLRNNRRVLRTLRSSPVIRSVADGVIGVPIPRRARSASTRRLHAIPEKSIRRSFSPSPATADPIGSSIPSPSCSGVSVKKKKKMKSGPSKPGVLSSVSSSTPRLPLEIQDDIEMEVAKTLSDLMKQSQSQSHSSNKQQNVDRDGTTNTADDEIKRLKAADDKNEQSITVNTETIAIDPAEKQVLSGDEFVNKGKEGSPKESVSPSCVEVNIQDPTVTKADHALTLIEYNKVHKELLAQLEAIRHEVRSLSFMKPPPLPSSSEKDTVVETQDVQKKNEISLKESSMSVANQPPQEKNGSKEHQDQSPLSFPVGTSGVSNPGFMPPPQAVLPINGTTKSSTEMQDPPFKFEQPWLKRCITHQYIAHDIQHHQQLIKKSREPTGPAALSETNLKLKQKVVPENQLLGDSQNSVSISGGSGKGKSSNVATGFTPTTNNLVLQRAPNQSPVSNLLQSCGFIAPFGQPQKIGNTSLPSNSAWKPSMSFNRPILRPNEAAPYMAMLQNNSRPFPISTNIPLLESHAMPFLNSSFYPSRAFNTSHKQLKLVENNYPTLATITPFQPPKNLDRVYNGLARSFPDRSMNFSMIQPGNKLSAIQQQSPKSRVDLIPQPYALTFGSNASTAPSLNFSSMAQNSAIFQNYQQQKNFQRSTGGSKSVSTLLNTEEQLNNVRRKIAERIQESTRPKTTPVETFGNSSVPTASSKGKQIVVYGPTAGPASSALPSQETEGSSLSGSPTCRRNVPSVVSARASQLPELK